MSASPPVNCLDAVRWQDQLLQSYRLHRLLLQAVLLGLGAIFLGVVILGESVEARLGYAVLLPLALAGCYCQYRFDALIRARRRDVYYWQRRLLEAELHYGGAALFREFKLEQVNDRRPGATVNDRDEAVALALGQEFGSPTRWVLDVILPRVTFAIWGIYLAIASLALIF